MAGPATEFIVGMIRNSSWEQAMTSKLTRIWRKVDSDLTIAAALG